jgi:hypothetical protein
MHEIPKIAVETTAFENHEKVCPCCGTVCCGEFPETVGSTQEYGPNLKGYIVMLAGYGMVGVRRIRALIGSIFGVGISEGTIARTVGECGKRLLGAVEGIKGGGWGQRWYILTRRG